MGKTHFDELVAEKGFYLGKYGKEVLLADSNGSPAKNAVFSIPLGTINATTNLCAFIAPAAGVLQSCRIATQDAIAKSDTNYWTIALIDKGATGAGTDKIAEKTTKSTGGEAFAAYKAWELGPLSATHKVLAAGDVVCLSFTKTENAIAFDEAVATLEFVYA